MFCWNYNERLLVVGDFAKKDDCFGDILMGIRQWVRASVCKKNCNEHVTLQLVRP
jgi:hypothetical protein